VSEQALTRPRRKRRSRRRTFVIMLVALGLVVGGCTAALFGLQARYDRNIERLEDPFAGLEGRPDPGPEGTLNYLLLGADSAEAGGGASRTDSIMLVHLPADRDGAYVMSIPRDSWVEIPGRGMAKINAAYAFGGAPLLIQTMESLTGVRIDHLAVLDFDGFVEMTDALGGVEVNVGEATGSLQAGRQRMDGETALEYVRERKELAGGDLDRVKRQQNWVRSVMSEALSSGTLTSPMKLDSFMTAATSSLAVDETFTMGEMRSVALSLRDIRSGDVTFFTVPVAGLGRSSDGQSIVELDEAATNDLWEAVRSDDVGAWVEQNRDLVLGQTVS